MAELVTQFEEATSNIEPSQTDKENAASAHAEVRECLEADDDLGDAGIDTVLIGSYKRSLSIRRVKDVDVFSKLPNLDDDLTSRELLDMFVEVLKPAYDGRLSRQDRSIKVDFPVYGLHVDVVPARPSGDYWEIPERSERGGGWQLTNPEALTELSSAMNKRYNGFYVPVVKLIRQTRQAHLGRRPGGFFFEVLTYHAFAGGIDGENTAQLYTRALSEVASALGDIMDGAEVADPTMLGETIAVRVTEAQMKDASVKFEYLASAAAALSDESRCRAAVAFRQCLGKDADGIWVFPLPPDCNEEGSQKRASSVSAGDPHVPAGDRRFA